MVAIVGNKVKILNFLEKEDEKKVYLIKPHRYKRSISANNYLHLIFQYIEDFGGTGYTDDELKEIFKARFLKTYSNKFKTTYIKPTHLLDSKELTEFIKKIRLWCIEFLNITIPDPEEKRMLEYYNTKF